MQIVYHPGRENSSADALSRNPHSELPSSSSDCDVQVAAVDSTIPPLDLEISQLLQQDSEQGYNGETVAGHCTTTGSRN